MVIAIDGPAGAGKSTIAERVARELGLVHLDTGALYRAVGLFAAENGIACDDEALTPRLCEIELKIVYKDGRQVVLLGGRDVSDEIRTPQMGELASQVSTLPGVREFLLELQRHLAREQSVIMDGRDIGTVVLPGADVKIFLTASPQDRAGRRLEDFKRAGVEISFEQVLGDVISRDAKDSGREISPLKPAEDAVIIDTTGNSFEQSARVVLDTIRARGLI